MVKSWLISLYRLTSRNRSSVMLALTAFAVYILFSEQVRAFLVIFALGFVATFSTFYKRVFQAPPAFELMTITIVAVSVFYGSLAGALYAIIVSITSEVAAQALDPFSITYTFPRVVVALTAPLLYSAGVGLIFIGLVSSLIYNGLQQPVYIYLTDVEKRIKSLYFSVLNIPINVLVFHLIGKPLFELLKVIA